MVENGTCRRYDRAGISESHLLNLSPHIGFLRQFDGTVAAFLVLGFTDEMMGRYHYPQALCVYLPTVSGSSFLQTQHYCLLQEDDLMKILEDPIVIPISLNRLNLLRTVVVKYDAHTVKYGLAYLKLCIRQCKAIQQSSFFDYLEEEAKSRMVTRIQQGQS